MPPVSIQVEDTAGVRDRNTLVPALERIRFHEPTRVVVYTYNGRTEDNLNEKFCGSPGQAKAGGRTLHIRPRPGGPPYPVGRHVGTYMGEDRKVFFDQRTIIQDTAKHLLRDAQWTDGTIAESGGRQS